MNIAGGQRAIRFPPIFSLWFQGGSHRQKAVPQRRIRRRGRTLLRWEKNTVNTWNTWVGFRLEQSYSLKCNRMMPAKRPYLVVSVLWLKKNLKPSHSKWKENNRAGSGIKSSQKLPAYPKLWRIALSCFLNMLISIRRTKEPCYHGHARVCLISSEVWKVRRNLDFRDLVQWWSAELMAPWSSRQFPSPCFLRSHVEVIPCLSLKFLSQSGICETVSLKN